MGHPLQVQILSVHLHQRGIMDITEKLVKEFEEEIHNRAHEIDPGDLEDWRSLTLGWALAKGLDPEAATRFAIYIRYETDLG